MDALVSAVLGDLTSRILSFIIERLSPEEAVLKKDLDCLSRLLLRTQIIIEEAERRHITGQAMLQQLQLLKEWMYKGNFLLDTMKYQMLQPERSNDEVSGHSSALSKLNPSKQLCFYATTSNMPFEGEGIKKIEQMLCCLNNIIGGSKGLDSFLKGYPPLCREPYSKYLVLDKCMFGRQAEMEQIMNFLLQEEPQGAESFGVVPIIGAPR